MYNKSWLAFLITLILSLSVLATESEFEFVVSSENCGKMTLKECEKFMVWAKKDSEETRLRIKVHQDNVNRMHEEALQILSEEHSEK